MIRIHYITLVMILLLVSSCATFKPYYSNLNEKWEEKNPPDTLVLDRVVFLIGDAGAADEDTTGKSNAALAYIKKQLEQKNIADSLKTILFLGDNIYPDGLPPEDAHNRDKAERRLITQMDVVKDFEGTTFFIPGNHDWAHSGPDGFNQLSRQRQYVEEYLERDAFKPDFGCPGPDVVELGDNNVLLIVDTEWWLHKYNRPYGLDNICDVADEFEFTVKLSDMLDRYKDKHIVLAMHHPLFSNGNHGGHYGIKDHIFPLTLVRPNYYFPLPLIGSIYPLGRMYGVSRQDISNPVYQKMKSAILAVAENRENLVIATGHDHTLQFHSYKEISHIISGSGCKVNFSRGGLGAEYVHSASGFAKINYYKNGEAWVEFWTVDPKGEGSLSFRKPLYALSKGKTLEENIEENTSYVDSSRIIAAGPEYKSRGLKKLFLGEHYRKEWRTPVKIKYLDFNTYKGGLKPIKLGGGRQTISLRMMSEEGEQYNIRSVNKDPSAVLPPGFEDTFAEDLVQDQISTSHPYGALTVPKLSNAVNVFYTKPEIFYIPFSPRLGTYMDEIGGMVAMVEIRPDEDLSDFDNFGNSKNVVGTTKMLEQINEDNDDEVDSYAFLRARMLDMLLGDWDRHNDQWRWAEYDKKDKGELIKPVPRDRDQVYVKFDGIIPAIASSRYVVRELTNFSDDYNDVKGMNMTGLALDRRILPKLDKKSWMALVDSMQNELTDEVIEDAIKDLPPEIYPISGEDIIRKLKARRDRLNEAAERYYDYMALDVDIVGSDKHEFVEVTRFEKGETQVKMYKMKKDGELKQLIFDRTFLPSETNEVRIYTLRGSDSVLVKGKGKKGIRVRVIGGVGPDVFIDSSKVSGWRNLTNYYDNLDSNTIISSSESRIMLKDDEYINEYKPNDYKFDYTGPTVGINYDKDYGFTPGFGLIMRTHDFRKEPYSTEQKVKVDFATKIEAFNLMYTGDFPMLFGRKSGMEVDARYYGSSFILNYFGNGNETNFNEEEDNIDNYRLQQESILLTALYKYKINQFTGLSIGPLYEKINLSAEIDHPIEEISSSGLDEESYMFTGVQASYLLDATEGSINPTRGLLFSTTASYRKNLNENFTEYTNWKNEFNFYTTPNLPVNLTFAFRFGLNTNFGGYNFFQSNTIGGRNEVRGYRRTRFAGRTAFYQNLELRLSISSVRNYVFSGNYGLHAFIDNGKVSSDGQDSRVLHTGIGGGAWLSIFNLVILSGDVAFSPEGTYVNVRMGHFF